MDQQIKERLLRICGQLIEEGNSVVATKFNTGPNYAPTTCVDVKSLHKWWGKIFSFGHQLGTSGRPWQEFFSQKLERNLLYDALGALGTLEAIKFELENGHLGTFTQLVRAETLADLLDQAQHLYAANYFLAAGVIARAVLEEHLRTTCEVLGCVPQRERPTINDFNQELYKCNHYNKTKMKHIDVLTSVGNDAAHNKPDLSADDVKKLLMELPGIIDSTAP